MTWTRDASISATSRKAAPPPRLHPTGSSAAAEAARRRLHAGGLRALALAAVFGLSAALPGLPALAADPASPSFQSADVGGLSWPGDSRRPRAEIPPMTAPPPHHHRGSSLPAAPSPQRGERAENSRDLGEHRPGELYLVPGEHRPGNLDNQGTFRPGDLG